MLAKQSINKHIERETMLQMIILLEPQRLEQSRYPVWAPSLADLESNVDSDWGLGFHSSVSPG